MKNNSIFEQDQTSRISVCWMAGEVHPEALAEGALKAVEEKVEFLKRKKK